MRSRAAVGLRVREAPGEPVEVIEDRGGIEDAVGGVPDHELDRDGLAGDDRALGGDPAGAAADGAQAPAGAVGVVVAGTVELPLTARAEVEAGAAATGAAGRAGDA